LELTGKEIDKFIILLNQQLVIVSTVNRPTMWFLLVVHPAFRS